MPRTVLYLGFLEIGQEIENPFNYDEVGHSATSGVVQHSLTQVHLRRTIWIWTISVFRSRGSLLRSPLYVSHGRVHACQS